MIAPVGALAALHRQSVAMPTTPDDVRAAARQVSIWTLSCFAVQVAMSQDGDGVAIAPVEPVGSLRGVRVFSRAGRIVYLVSGDVDVELGDVSAALGAIGAAVGVTR